MTTEPIKEFLFTWGEVSKRAPGFVVHFLNPGEEFKFPEAKEPECREFCATASVGAEAVFGDMVVRRLPDPELDAKGLPYHNELRGEARAAVDLVSRLLWKKHEEPKFVDFIRALRAESAWVRSPHGVSDDPSTESLKLEELATTVERTARDLGYLKRGEP